MHCKAVTADGKRCKNYPLKGKDFCSVHRKMQEVTTRGTDKEQEEHRKNTCSFCGKHVKELDLLITAPGANICDECVRFFNEMVIENSKE